MKNIKTIALTICAFVAGIIATLAFLYIFVMPNMSKEIGIFANESAMNAYNMGYDDGEQGNYKFDDWFDNETQEYVNNYDYKFIR